MSIQDPGIPGEPAHLDHPVVSGGGAGRAGRAVLASLVSVLLLVLGFAVGQQVAGDDDGDGGSHDSGSGEVTPVAQSGGNAGNNSNDTASTPVLEGDETEPAAAVAEVVAPAVVQIEAVESLGAGIIYDSDGLVITNGHVVGASDSVRLTLADGRQYDGEVLGVDNARDVAVVSFDPDGADIPTAVLATDDEVAVGQLAVAVGSPFGLDQTVTAGIISAVGRPLEGPGGELFLGMLQTDAPINSGNSGGALADRFGRVIGINTSIQSRFGDNAGIGFAIPMSLASRIAESIVDGSVPGITFLGVGSPEQGNGLPDGVAGAFIDSITPDSAADGVIDVGDVVVAADGHPVRDFRALAAFIGSYLPGDEVELTIVREDERQTVTVELGERTAEMIQG